MQSMLNGTLFRLVTKRNGDIRRRLRLFPVPVFPVLALVFGLFLAGCSFVQPDFSPEGSAGAVSSATPAEGVAVGVNRNSNSGVESATPSRKGEAAPAKAKAGIGLPSLADAQSPPAAAINPAGGTGALSLGGPGIGDAVPAAPQDGRQGDSTDLLIDGIGGLDPAAVVAAYEQVLGDIYTAALPSVVLIRVSKNLGASQEMPAIPGLPDDFFQHSGGSGFVWDNEGHIVTNHHVVSDADRVTVILPDRTEMEAKVLGTDPDSDLAVIKVQDTDGVMVPVTLGDSDQVNVGQVAVALGNPFGQQFSITSGIISGVGRTIRSGHSPFSIPEVLQTDAPINPGNSGGPLLDRNGHVIGVNTQIISRSGSNSGIGFAVPINIAKQVIPALLEKGHFQYSWLGISGSSIIPDIAEAMGLPGGTLGALVIEVVPDSPAAKAGLRGSDRTMLLEGLEIPVGGDIVVAIDGNPVDGIDDIIAYLVGNTRPDQEIVLEVLRDGGREEIKVTLGTRPGSM